MGKRARALAAFYAQVQQKWNPTYIVKVGHLVLMLRDSDQALIAERFDGRHFLSSYSDIISVELTPTYSSSHRTTGGGANITGAVAGGLLLGPVGAIIGGAGKRQRVHETTWLSLLVLQLTARFDGTVQFIPLTLHRAPLAAMAFNSAQAMQTGNKALAYFRHAMQVAQTEPLVSHSADAESNLVEGQRQLS